MVTHSSVLAWRIPGTGEPGGLPFMGSHRVGHDWSDLAAAAAKEAEDIKKRWQEYTEELHKKDLHDPDNHNGVITHLEPDILECEAKWALGSITMNKVSGGDGIPPELFQIIKDDAVKVLYSICQQSWKTQQWPQDWKRSVFIPIPKKGNAEEILTRFIWLYIHLCGKKDVRKAGFSTCETVSRLVGKWAWIDYSDILMW